MAKRLMDGVLDRETDVADAQLGRGICRNCGGAIVLDAASVHGPRLPRRRICRKCGAEYGTTKGG